MILRKLNRNWSGFSSFSHWICDFDCSKTVQSAFEQQTSKIRLDFSFLRKFEFIFQKTMKFWIKVDWLKILEFNRLKILEIRPNLINLDSNLINLFSSWLGYVRLLGLGWLEGSERSFDSIWNTMLWRHEKMLRSGDPRMLSSGEVEVPSSNLN